MPPRTAATSPSRATVGSQLGGDAWPSTRYHHVTAVTTPTTSNAGVGGHGTIAEQTLNDWNWLIDVNLRGVVHVLHTFLPAMLANPRGSHIVNTASIAGLCSVVSGPYTATKYAVVGISETLRHELAGTGVGISVLCPGLVNTNLSRSERNRPAELPNDAAGKRTAKWALPTNTRPVVLDPATVAAMVMAAVANDEFWIVTDPSLLALAWPRYGELQAIAFGNRDTPSG